MKAIVMNGTGGREMLEYVERPDPVAGPGQALVEIAFAGVNFMDIGVRQGMAWTEMPIPRLMSASRAAAESSVMRRAPSQRAALTRPASSRKVLFSRMIFNCIGNSAGPPQAID